MPGRKVKPEHKPAIFCVGRANQSSTHSLLAALSAARLREGHGRGHREGRK